MKDFLKITLLVVILVTAILLEHNFASQSKNIRVLTNGELAGTNQEITVNLRIDFDNGEIKSYDNIKIERDKTVFDLLKGVAEENNLEFSFREYQDLGALVESIDNVKNDFNNNKWWQFWVNGEYATIGASSFQLKEGDLVEWKFVKGQF